MIKDTIFSGFGFHYFKSPQAINPVCVLLFKIYFCKLINSEAHVGARKKGN
jgi:hypothetical protein